MSQSQSQASLPAHLTLTLTRLEALVGNLWWSWGDAQGAWLAPSGKYGGNPRRMLRALQAEGGEALASYLSVYGDDIARAHAAFERYMSPEARVGAWHARAGAPCGGGARGPEVAYFCAEFGIHESVAIYSGGLGILAGDHVKSASDLGLPFVGVGLLYRNGYVQQRLDASGYQQSEHLTYDFADYPVTLALAPSGAPLVVEVPVLGERCWARVWRLAVGRVEVLLLDADIEPNTPAQRQITAKLYGGDGVTRVQQELLLGVGGVRALRALGYAPATFHLNEGHSSFLSLERLREGLAAGEAWGEALARVRATSVFTTHTPVEAGHDRFDPELAWRALSWLSGPLSLTREGLLALGRWPDERDPHALFNMTLLAFHTCAHLNGVAALHGEVSREMFARFWGVTPAEAPISHVTNGVHAPTWQEPTVRALLGLALGGEGAERELGDEAWGRVYDLPDEALWGARSAARARLLSLAHRREAARRARLRLPAWESRLDPHGLTIGFARRFATYKRASLIFSELDRLIGILERAPGPVQLLFSGKAHPADEGGKALARAVYEASEHPALRGRVLLVEDYDIEVGRAMVRGADVWLNNPRRPKEASGTSGMKVAMSGGLNLSILDGWWPEGFNGRNGWAIGEPKLYVDEVEQDREDAESLYQVLEREVIPAFFERDEAGLPRRWLQSVKESIATCTPGFHSDRQVRDYVRELYSKARP
jgi:starch phosphorylase